MLDIQNTCPYGSRRGGSRTLTISNMELFVTIVKWPGINDSAKSSILDVAGILHPSVYRACSTNSIDGSIVYNSIVPFGMTIHPSVFQSHRDLFYNLQNDVTVIFAKQIC